MAKDSTKGTLCKNCPSLKFILQTNRGQRITGATALQRFSLPTILLFLMPWKKEITLGWQTEYRGARMLMCWESDCIEGWLESGWTERREVGGWEVCCQAGSVGVWGHAQELCLCACVCLLSVWASEHGTERVSAHVEAVVMATEDVVSFLKISAVPEPHRTPLSPLSVSLVLFLLLAFLWASTLAPPPCFSSAFSLQPHFPAFSNPPCSSSSTAVTEINRGNKLQGGCIFMCGCVFGFSL